MATKQIPVSKVTVGMYVVKLDRPWPWHSTLAERHRITNHEDIDLLKDHGVRFVTIDPTLGKDVVASKQTPPPTSPPIGAALDSLAVELGKARAVRSEAMTTVQSIFEGVKTGAPISIESVKQTVQTLIDSVLRHHDTLLCLSHLRQFDTDVFAHAIDVCVFALVIGKHQGFSSLQLKRLGCGALLHDVGKMRLPRNLLHKSGVYTEQERYLMQQHPRLGLTVLMHADGIHNDSLRIVAEHHERIDGSGYPAGLRGDRIHPLSEIVGIADVYDAMLSSRYGRPPFLPAQAIKELYQAGLKGEFDPRWVERIVRCLGIYPVGSLVELNTGERGIVTAVNPADALRPTVKIIWDATRQPYPAPCLVSLAAPTAPEPQRTIVCTLDPDQENVDMHHYLEEVITSDGDGRT
jgi:HD-GYP domain-containing protein (c-di-GMP phosphodiesterase class II)